MLSLFQVAPASNLDPTGASQTSTAAPAFSGTVFSLPPVKNPISRPSGFQNTNVAPLVPSTARYSSEPIGRTHTFGPPVDEATTAR